MTRSDSLQTVQAEVLIIGAGAAGLRTALELKTRGIEPLLISDRTQGDAHTKFAAGGINASLGTHDPDDRWQIHAADTLREGHFINDPEAVRLVTRNAPEAVRELGSWGCPFDKTAEGAIDQRYFGAQSFRRTCFSGDQTGQAILDTLEKRARERKISFRDQVRVIRIITENQQVTGALALDMESDRLIWYQTSQVVLAAGGYASIYHRSTSRSDENLGGSASLALDAGAWLMDMEMVQFHPTGMVQPKSYEGELVTEAVRGEGGRLLNADGERFMERYSPGKMELDARDVVARSIMREIADGRGTDSGGVYLDISAEEPETIQKRLPEVYHRFMDLGIDITREPVEVAPVSHYGMGGVQVDFRSGRTSVRGLYAVGEAAGGLHGANRLGGNSLVETVVSGALAGRYIAETVRSEGVGTRETESSELKLDHILNCRPDREALDQIRQLMWDRAGLLRRSDELERGLNQLFTLRKSVKLSSRIDRMSPEEISICLNLENVLQISELVLTAALMREESRGAHYREDFPDSEKEWLVNIRCSRGADGELKWDRQPVSEVHPELRKALDENHSLDYHHLE